MRDKKLIETITVLGIPVALFDDGSVEAVEIGPFPFSESGYRSLYPLSSADHPIPAVDRIIKELEQTAKENGKKIAEAEKNAEKLLKQKPGKDPVGDYIALSGGIIWLTTRAYFQEWPVSERMLKTALRLAKKCGKIVVPEDFSGHPAWPAEFLKQKIAAVREMEPILERCIDAKNLYELSVSSPIDNLHSTNSTYARLFEAKIPELPPNAATFFYARLCAAHHQEQVTEDKLCVDCHAESGCAECCELCKNQCSESQFCRREDPLPSADSVPVSVRHFFHGADWVRYPWPDSAPMTLASAMPKGVCHICPLACRGHILVPSDNNPHSRTKYCTLTAIAAGLLTTETALADGQSEPSEDDVLAVDALVASLGQCLANCSRWPECLNTITDHDHECLVKRDAAAPPSAVVPSQPEPEQPPQPEPLRPKKTAYIFGWMSTELPERPSAQLYVYKQRNDWGVTYDPAEASRFKSVEAVLDWYRANGGVHGDPETNSYNGHLKIFEDGPLGLRPVPRPTRQGGLFDKLPSLEIVEKQPDLIRLPEAADCFTPDERKLLAACYVLVKYDREQKTIQQTYIPPKKGWAPSVAFQTYAAAERTLKEALAAENVVEVGLDGKVNMSSCSRNRLLAAGFDFYRSEGVTPGHGHDVPRIKQGSKNWGTWEKYETPEELQVAWDELMKDGKALQG